MQEAADNLVKYVGIWVAAISTILTLCSPLVGIVTFALISSGLITADSKWAVFVAKLFPLSLHARSGQSTQGVKDAMKITGASLFVGLLLLSGCSLETARQTRINSQLQAERAGRTAATRPEAECKALDSFHVYTLYGAEVSLGVGVAAGIVASKTDGKMQNAALATGITTAAIAGGLAYVSQRSGSQWAERCGQ